MADGRRQVSMRWRVATVAALIGLGAAACGSEGSSDAGGDADSALDAADAAADALDGHSDASDTALDGSEDTQLDATPDTGEDTGDATPDSSTDGEADGEEPEVPPGTWRQIQPPSITTEHVFKGLWMGSPDAGHIVGASGIAVEFAGDDYDIVSEGVFPNLNAVWGASPSDVWAVGIGGQLLHWDGEMWRTPGGCGIDADCNDSDPCTADVCGGDGACEYTGVAAGPGCCGTPSFSEGFDSGSLGDWQVAELYPAAPGAPEVHWHIFGHTGSNGVARFTSAPYALYFGNSGVPCPGTPELTCPNYEGAVGSPVGGTATSGDVKVPSGSSVEVRFNAWIDTEGTPGFDVLSLAAVVGGVEIPLWQADTTHFSFQPYSVDVSALAGQTVRFRFKFDSVDDFANSTEGVYIDDIALEATCGPLPASEGGAGPGVGNATLFDIWGSSASNIYAGGLNGALLHYDGNQWSSLDIAGGVDGWSLNGLFGFGADLIAVGEAGLVLAGSGGELDAQPTPVQVSLEAAWGNAPNDVYAVGQNGTILHRTEGAWMLEPAGTQATLHGIWGVGAFSVVAVGTQGTILRKVEGNWVPDVSGTGLDLYDVWAQGSTNVWAVGEAGALLRDSGAGWEMQSSPVSGAMRAIHGASPTNVWAVGDAGATIRYDGSTWSIIDTPGAIDWQDVWVGTNGKVILVGPDGFMVIGNADGWNEMSNPFAPAPVRAVWAGGPNDVYAAGEGYVIHYDGNKDYEWSVFATTVAPATWRGICGSGPDNVLLVGAGGSVARFNGKNWSMVPVQPDAPADPEADPIPITDQLYGCHALGPDRAWAVGENGLVLELDGGKFVRGNNQIPISLRRVFAHDESLIFAIGIEGFAMYARGPGQPWFPMFTGSVAGLFGIDGTSLDDITVVGDRGTILRFVPDPDASGDSR